MTTLTVTATQGNGANGMLLRVFVLTGANAVASQSGASTNNQFASTTTFTQSITTSASSNVYGAASHGLGTTDTGSNATITDSLDDSTNGWHYDTFHALNVTAGATARGFTLSPTAQSGPFAQLEILPSGTLAEDGSAPASVNTFTAQTITTASFTPPGGSLLVACVGSNGGAGVTTMTVTDNLGVHLNWTEKVKNNPSGGDYAGVWIADVPAAAGAAGAALPAVPGKTWLRRFHHRQAPPQFPAAAVVITSGPPVYPLTGPVGLGRRQPPAVPGSAGGSGGLFAQAGSPVYPLQGPVRIRPSLPSRGRTASNEGARSQAGPPVTPPDGPVTARIRVLPPRGRISSSGGVRAQAGPPVTPPDGPVAARVRPLPPRGRTASNEGTFTAAAPQAGPPVYPLQGPVRTRPQPPMRGRCAAVRGVRAQQGPSVRQLHGPVAAFRPGPFIPGRCDSRAGTFSQPGPAFYPLRGPHRARIPQPVRGGHVTGNPGAPLFIPPPPPFGKGYSTGTTVGEAASMQATVRAGASSQPGVQ